MPASKSKKIKEVKKKKPSKKEVFPKITVGNYSKHIVHEDGTIEFEIDYDAARQYVDEILTEYRIHKDV